MPELNSPISTPVGMAAINAAHVGKQAGGAMHFPTFAAFTAAITIGTTSYSSPLWFDRQEMSIASEPSGVVRRWSVSLGHARTFTFAGQTFVLDANTNTIYATVGTPAGSVGASGDYAVDPAIGIFKRTGALWKKVADNFGGSAPAQLSGFPVGNSLRPRQIPSTGDPCDTWLAQKQHAVGDRVLPSAYRIGSTFTNGFISTNGRLYHLICVVAGKTGGSEPAWKDPANISNYSFYNSGTGSTQLDIVDGTVTWRIRPIVFIDPTYAGGSNDGSQVRPYTGYTEVNATSGSAWGTIATDTDGTSTADAKYASIMTLQRAGTTVTAPVPVLLVRGPAFPTSASPDAFTRYQSGVAADVDNTLRQTLYGAYRKPGDLATKAKIVGTGSGGNTVQNVNRYVRIFQDLDASCLASSGSAFYQEFYGPNAAGIRIIVRRCDGHDTNEGAGFVVNAYGGDSGQVGASGLVYEDCNAWDVGGHGFQHLGSWAKSAANVGDSVQHYRCRAWRCGKDTTSQAYNHGFSAIAHRFFVGNGTSDGTTGWTSLGGNIYSRALSSITRPSGTLDTLTDIVATVYRSAGGIFPAQLMKNTATPSTPGAGQFGVANGNWYINLGAALDVRVQLIGQMSVCKDAYYEQCEAFNVPYWKDPGVEGFGFCSDEFSQSVYKDCWGHHNGTGGLFCHYGVGSTWIGGSLSDNASVGVAANVAVSTTVRDAEIVRNPDAGVLAPYSSADTRVYNCNIGGSRDGIVRMGDPTIGNGLVYPVETYAYRSSVAAGGNSFANVVNPYMLTAIPSNVSSAVALQPGDLVY